MFQFAVYLIIALFTLSWLASSYVNFLLAKYVHTNDDRSRSLAKSYWREYKQKVCIGALFFFLAGLFFPITLLFILLYYLKNKMF